MSARQEDRGLIHMARHIGTDLYDAFVAVAEMRGFTAAVERLNRTQTTVSQQIKRLESLVGCDLFVRNTRNVELTSAGKALLPYARQILQLNKQATNAVNGTMKYTVHVGIPDIYAEAVLPEFIELLRALDDQVAPVVSCDDSARLLERFSSGGLDIAVAARCRDCTTGQTVCIEELAWVGAQGYEFPPCQSIPLILSSEGCPFRARALATLDSAGISWNIVYTGGSLAVINPLLMQGLGITVMPRRRIPAGQEEVGERLGLPAIQVAAIDLQVSMQLVTRYGETLKSKLEAAAVRRLTENVDSGPGTTGYERMERGEAYVHRSDMTATPV